MLKLTEGLEAIKDLTDEEKKEIAHIFKESADLPLAHAWEKIFKLAIRANYYHLAHLSSTLSPEERNYEVALITGRITELEALIGLPAQYVKYIEDMEDNAD